MTDAGSKGVVDGRMAKRTLYAERREFPGRVEAPGDANHRVGFQEHQRRGRIVEIDFAGLERIGNRSRHRIDVDFEADAQRRFRAHARFHAAQLLAGNGAMQLQRVAPVRFVAERLEPEDAPSLVEHSPGIVGNGPIALGARRPLSALSAGRGSHHQTHRQHLRWNRDPEPANRSRLHIVPSLKFALSSRPVRPQSETSVQSARL